MFSKVLYIGKSMAFVCRIHYERNIFAPKCIFHQNSKLKKIFLIFKEINVFKVLNAYILA